MDCRPIVLPGIGGRLEILPKALLYPSLGTNAGNLVAILVRVISDKVRNEFEWDGSISEFTGLYENLQAFPAEGPAFEFPTQVIFCGGSGVHIQVEPLRIHGWQVHCKISHGDDVAWPQAPRSQAEVSFRLDASAMEARQQTADFLRFAASLAS